MSAKIFGGALLWNEKKLCTHCWDSSAIQLVWPVIIGYIFTAKNRKVHAISWNITQTMNGWHIGDLYKKCREEFLCNHLSKWLFIYSWNKVHTGNYGGLMDDLPSFKLIWLVTLYGAKYFPQVPSVKFVFSSLYIIHLQHYSCQAINKKALPFLLSGATTDVDCCMRFY